MKYQIFKVILKQSYSFCHKWKNLKVHPNYHSFFDHKVQNLKSYSVIRSIHGTHRTYPPANRFFSRCHTYGIVVIDKLSCKFFKNNLKTVWTRMELVSSNLVIYLTKNQKPSYEQASSVLKERLHPSLLEDFVVKGIYL